MLLEDQVQEQDHLGDAKSLRQNHSEWFVRVAKRFERKEDYLNAAFELRIDRYIKHLEKKLDEKFIDYPSNYNRELQTVKDDLYKILAKEKNHRRYWDRRCPLDTSRFCDAKGNFNCINHIQKHCVYHFINPYRSRAEKILFQRDWELDHM